MARKPVSSCSRRPDPTRENVLQPGELLKEIRVPAAAGWKSAYPDVRAGFDWPLVSAVGPDEEPCSPESFEAASRLTDERPSPFEAGL